MKILTSLCVFFVARAVRSHGDHGEPATGETVQQYAQRHMASEHHIDSFDLRSFFQLHDLNRDGFWDREEIEAIYGVHHIYSQKKSKDDLEHQKKADHIVNAVLNLLDKDKDSKVTHEEFEAVGLDGLPNFDDLGAEGHHYDVESEFFLHHEEQYHSTPETQTDESYIHPEDLEHFAHHDAIERQEAEREAKFQGITVEEVIRAQHQAEAPHPPPAPASGEPPVLVDNMQHPHDDQRPPAQQEPVASSKPKVVRLTPPENQEPSVKYAGATKARDTQSEWGQGDAGYKTPKTPVDRMRKNLPYKYKFRRNWGDF